MGNGVKPIIIFGAGGLAREVSWLIDQINHSKKQWNILGYVVENPKEFNQTVRGYPVFKGLDEVIKSVLPKVGPCAVAIAVGSKDIRYKIVEQIRNSNADFEFPNLFHPGVLKDDSTFSHGRGNIIAAGATLTTDVAIGSFNILNLGSLVAHNVQIGDFCEVWPKTTVNGNVKIGDMVTLGAGCVIMPDVTVGDNSTVAIGSIVGTSVDKNTVVAGNPARVVRVLDNPKKDLSI